MSESHFQYIYLRLNYLNNNNVVIVGDIPYDTLYCKCIDILADI